MKNNERPGVAPRPLGVLVPGFYRMAREPVHSLWKFWQYTRTFFAGFPREYPRTRLGEIEPCRATAWTDALNLTWWLTFWPGLFGMLLALRDRRSWPVLLWFVYLTLVTNLVFFSGTDPGRFRFSLLPVIAVFAGSAVNWVVSQSRDRLARLSARPGSRPRRRAPRDRQDLFG